MQGTQALQAVGPHAVSDIWTGAHVTVKLADAILLVIGLHALLFAFNDQAGVLLLMRLAGTKDDKIGPRLAAAQRQGEFNGDEVLGETILADKRHLNTRASHVQTKSAGDPAKIQSSGLDIQAAPTPTTSMPQRQNAVATTGDMPGEIDLACNAVAKAKSYLWECRVHEEGQPPGPWTALKPAGKSTSTATGLDPGKQYAFRVQVLGPNEILSPWSDECIARAA